MGINIPDGFATTADAFRLFLKENELEEPLDKLMRSLDLNEFSNLSQVSQQAKQLVLQASLPIDLMDQIVESYNTLCKGNDREVAVRSSATAEDLPTASFAGQHDSFLNVNGKENLLEAVKKSFASLYNARAIKYRVDNGFEHGKVALSAGIQLMVRADKACSGVCFTIEPDSGFAQSVIITGCWGLGENIVQGAVTPDEFHVFKPAIGKFPKPIISKKMGSKARTMIYAEKGSGTINEDTPESKQRIFTLHDQEIIKIAAWALIIEKHYRMPMGY